MSVSRQQWERQRAAARELMQRWGAAPQAYFTLMPGISYLFSPARDAVLGYRVADGVAIVLRDPAGSPAGIAAVLEDFHRLCREQKWLPCFLAATPALLTVHQAAGLRALKLGAEALLDLPGLRFAGKAWQDVRTALSRLPREGYRAEWYPLATDPQGRRGQLAAISAHWLAVQGGRYELGFALGTWELAQRYAAEQRQLVLLDPTGAAAAFMTFIPCAIPGGGWSLDLLRHPPGLPAGSMEYLIATAIQQFQTEDCSLLSLGLAPLAQYGADDSGGDPRLLERAARAAIGRIGQRYDVDGLTAFKAKFSPRWEPRYLAYPQRRNLPRVLLSLLHAHTAPAPADSAG